jgi:hypothetical protein
MAAIASAADRIAAFRIEPLAGAQNKLCHRRNQDSESAAGPAARGHVCRGEAVEVGVPKLT